MRRNRVDGSGLRVGGNSGGERNGAGPCGATRNPAVPPDRQPSAPSPHWSWSHFDNLTASDLYDILQARNAVFVVEQACPFQDCDGVDRVSHHLWTRGDTGELAAYLRIVPPATIYDEPSIGRIITASSARRCGLGRLLVSEGIRRLEHLYGTQAIRIGAQKYLLRFYEQFGFRPTGRDYEEDGIAHCEMLRYPS